MRRTLGYVLVAAALCSACKGKEEPAKTSVTDPCERLANSCSDDKHAAKLADECKAAAAKQGCPDKVGAMYVCFEQDVCSAADKAWALEDLKKLADRKQACAAERKAVLECPGGGK
jgi:hypothetical protein